MIKPITLPPLPDDLIAHRMTETEVRSLLKQYDERCATAAIEADRQARGEPVAWLRNERDGYEGKAVFDPLVILGSAPPTKTENGATYSPVFGGLQPQQQATNSRQDSHDNDDPSGADGYAYRYRHINGGTVLRFNHGEGVNGSRPIEAVPFWFKPQPTQIPEGYKLVPIEPTAQNIEGEGIVEKVTKAILFADCGSTEDWQDNLYLGEAVLQALVPHLPPEMGASEWAELHILRAERGPSDGGHKTWKEAAIAERCKRVLMAPRKEIVALAKEGLSVYTGPNMNEHKICAEIVRLSAMLEAAPEPKGKP